MPGYSYTALNHRGMEVSGNTVATSEHAARSELAEQGLFVQTIKSHSSSSIFTAKKIKLEEFALFNQEFMALIRAGLTIPDALALAADRPDNARFGAVLSQVLLDIKGGAPLSDACSRHPEIFERLYLAALRTGEKTGALAEVLGRYHDYLRHRVSLIKKLNQAMTYPVFLLVVLVLILIILFVFVMPRFVSMYTDLGAELPAPTRVLLIAVQYMYIVLPVIMAVVVTVVMLLRRWKSTVAGRRTYSRLQEKTPYIGEITRIVITAQMARSISTLLSGGTPLVEALRTTMGSVTNQLYLDRLEMVISNVLEGRTLAESVRQTKLMPEMASRMIDVGESSGGLEVMLEDVAHFYEEALDTKLSRVMSLVEPLMMLIMGILIGGIIIVMYLPVFHLADVIK